MSSMTGARAVTEIPHPCPPGVMSSSASLFPAAHPELTNVCYPVLCASAQVLHQGRNRFCWSLIHVTGKGEQGILVPSTVHWSQKFSWVLFQILEIFIKSSQIFWVYHFGYLREASLRLFLLIRTTNSRVTQSTAHESKLGNHSAAIGGCSQVKELDGTIFCERCWSCGGLVMGRALY